MRNPTIVCLPPLPAPYYWSQLDSRALDIRFNDSQLVHTVARVIVDNAYQRMSGKPTAMLWADKDKVGYTWRQEFTDVQEAINVVAARVLLGEFT